MNNITGRRCICLWEKTYRIGGDGKSWIVLGEEIYG